MDVFVRLGFQRREAAVYCSCLSLGRSSASSIARKANIQRTYCYDIADTLVKKGVLKKTRKGKRYVYEAVPPREVLNVYKKNVQELQNVLPELEALSDNRMSHRAPVYYYEGKEGIEELEREANLSGGELLVFTDEAFLKKEQGIYEKRHVERRIQSKTRCRTIVGLSAEALRSREWDVEAIRETRILPRDLFVAHAMIGMYRDRSFVINYTGNFAYVLNDPEVTATLKMIFEFLWKSGRVL